MLAAPMPRITSAAMVGARIPTRRPSRLSILVIPRMIQPSLLGIALTRHAVQRRNGGATTRDSFGDFSRHILNSLSVRRVGCAFSDIPLTLIPHPIMSRPFEIPAFVVRLRRFPGVRAPAIKPSAVQRRAPALLRTTHATLVQQDGVGKCATRGAEREASSEYQLRQARRARSIDYSPPGSAPPTAWPKVHTGCWLVDCRDGWPRRRWRMS